eukprot:1158293-Pelagomonas_calceolata.AAC.5
MPDGIKAGFVSSALKKAVSNCWEEKDGKNGVQSGHKPKLLGRLRQNVDKEGMDGTEAGIVGSVL